MDLADEYEKHGIQKNRQCTKEAQAEIFQNFTIFHPLAPFCLSSVHPEQSAVCRKGWLLTGYAQTADGMTTDKTKSTAEAVLS